MEMYFVNVSFAFYEDEKSKEKEKLGMQIPFCPFPYFYYLVVFIISSYYRSENNVLFYHSPEDICADIYIFLERTKITVFSLLLYI